MQLLWLAVPVLGILLGFDLGSAAGTVIELKPELQTPFVYLTYTGATLGAAVAGWFTRSQRRRLLAVALALTLVGSLGLASSQDSAALIFSSRCALGAGLGALSCVTPVLAAELAPTRLRGSVVAAFEIAVAAGILLAYAAGGIFSWTGVWILLAGLTLLCALVVAWLPESPRWRAMRHPEEAEEAMMELQRLGEYPEAALAAVEQVKLEKAFRAGDETVSLVDEAAQQADDEAETPSEATAEARDGTGSDEVNSVVASTASPPMSQQTAWVTGIGLAVLQQLTGKPSMVSFVGLFLVKVGPFQGGGSSVTLALVCIALSNLLFTCASVYLVDRLGRKPLLLSGIAAQAVSLAGAAILTWDPEPAEKRSAGWGWALTLAMAVYFAGYAVSFATNSWVYFAEVGSTTATRVRTSATFVGASMLTNMCVAFAMVPLTEALGFGPMVLLFGVLCGGVAVPFVALVVPETKQALLEEVAGG